MDDIHLIAEAMQVALVRKLGDEIDLIFQYGSSLKGTTHQYSDLDMSYVPVHEATQASITVMVGETLFDLYPMRWSHLERMADFYDPSSTVLLENRVVYRRTEAAEERFRALSERLRAQLRPEAQAKMIQRAQEIFQSTGYAYYLLRQQAAAGHRLGCLQQTQSILRTVLHCLAVCNQACIDTRKMMQVLALPKLPEGLAETVRRITLSHEPDELLSACERLLQTTRDLLLAEQRQVMRHETTFSAVFNAAYPELKRDLQGVLLGCERQDMFYLKGCLISLYHELALGMTQVFTGIEYTGFNSLAEYEQDLVALGFPALMPYVVAGDFAELARQCLAFDQHLRKFLTEHSVELYTFAALDELHKHLEANYPKSLQMG